MIERYGSMYELNCDYCSNCQNDFDDFQEVIDYKKANGWKTRKMSNGDWEDKCPNCQN